MGDGQNGVYDLKSSQYENHIQNIGLLVSYACQFVFKRHYKTIDVVHIVGAMRSTYSM